MHDYLHQIKSIVDSLAAIKSPISDLQLIQYTLIGLGSDYGNFVANLSFLDGGIIFNEFRTCLLFYEHHVNYVRNCQHGVVTHQVFAATTN